MDSVIIVSQTRQTEMTVNIYSHNIVVHLWHAHVFHPKSNKINKKI